MVNFMCQLGEAKGCLAGKTLFLGVSIRVFLEEIRIWVKKICPHQCGDPKENKKMKGEWIPSPWIRGETFMVEAWKWHTSFLPIWHLLEFSHVAISNCGGGGEAGKCGLAACPWRRGHGLGWSAALSAIGKHTFHVGISLLKKSQMTIKL